MNKRAGKRDPGTNITQNCRPHVGNQNSVRKVLSVTLVVLLGGEAGPTNHSVLSNSQSKTFGCRCQWTGGREARCLPGFKELKCRWMESTSE